MRALVTGASGFLGTALVRHLAASGYRVTGLSRRLEGRGTHCDWLRLADPMDGATLPHWIDAHAPDVIFHLAGSAGAPPDEQRLCGIVLTSNLLAAIARVARPPTVLLVGSAAEYGELSPEQMPAGEELPCRPVTPYGGMKLEQTKLGLTAAAVGLPVVVARLFNVVGPGLPEHLALGRFARQLAEMGEGGVLITGPLDAERDFVALDDVVRVLAALARTGEASGRVVNVCSGRAASMAMLASLLLRISGRRARIAIDPARHGISTVPQMVGDPTRLRALGLTVPPPDFEAELARLWQAALAARSAGGQ